MNFILFLCLNFANLTLSAFRGKPKIIGPSYSSSDFSYSSYSHDSPVWVSSSSYPSRSSYHSKASVPSSYHDLPSKPKCHTVNKLVCSDVEVEDVEYKTETECQTKDVEKCFTVPQSKVETREVEECQQINVGFRKAVTSSSGEVCVDFTEDVCDTLVRNVESKVSKKECNNVCSESCSQVSRQQCGPITKEVPSEEFVRECTMKLVTQCKDDYQNPGHYSCHKGADGREICPTHQKCEDVWLEKCDQKRVWVTKTVNDCQCKDVSDTKCEPTSTEVCTDVVVTETKPVVEEQCRRELKTACETKTDLTSVEYVLDDSCIGADSDPDCFSVSKNVCYSREIDNVVYDETEECVTVPCEQCHDRLVQVPTVNVESECRKEPTEVCEPEDKATTPSPSRSYHKSVSYH